jgi:sodium-dependent phosphate cotransporter
LLFVFLVGVKGMGDGFKLLGEDVLEKFFTATENPFISLIVGILATALVQSSSVTTSMIVGLVASPENPLPLANAVPMIMGANIGTTVTNMIVSLAHMGRREEFRRAFAVATVHDFFNIMAVAILLPLELATGFLQKTSGLLVSVVSGLTGAQYESPIKGAIAEGVHPIKELTTVIFSSPQGQGILLALISGGLIFIALFALVRVMRSVMMTRVETYISRFVGGPALLAIAVGTVVTVMVQSSSITTSLLVPLAGAGLLSAQQAFPLTIGANLGTTVTALLAERRSRHPHCAGAFALQPVGHSHHISYSQDSANSGGGGGVDCQHCSTLAPLGAPLCVRSVLRHPGTLRLPLLPAPSLATA